jgi:PEP-CTERM motif
MKNIMTKAIIFAATSAALSGALVFSFNPSAQAITLQFNWRGDAGYSAIGTFSYDETTAPTIISESGIGPTNVLESLTVSFFNPSNNPLASYNTVAGGVSESAFFNFNFDTSTQTLFGGFNVGGGTGIIGELFFTGTIGGLLELRQDVDQMGTSILLDSQDPGVVTVSVSQVPEPASMLGLMGLGAMGAGFILKKKRS